VFDAQRWTGCWVFSLLAAFFLLPCAERMKIPCGWLTYVLYIFYAPSPYIYVSPSFSWPNETSLIPCAYCVTSQSKKYCHSLHEITVIPSVWSTTKSLWFQFYIMLKYRIRLWVSCVCVCSVWPQARCNNDNFLWSGCNGLAPASASLALFAHATGSVCMCVFCSNDDNIPRTTRGRTVFMKVAY